jgi:5-methylcytosine-specific restriction endonuclease McrA
MTANCVDCKAHFTARRHATPWGYVYSSRCPDCGAAARCNRRWSASRAAVVARDPMCRMAGCKNATVHVHHLDAVTHGGSNNPENLVGLCQRCHSTIHSLMSLAARTNNERTQKYLQETYAEWAAENAALAAGSGR